MKQHRIAVGLLVLLWIAGSLILFADERPPYDIILVIDKSLSMEEKIGIVKNFARDSIIEENVQIGDYLVIIDFYGKAELLASFPVNSEQDKDRAKSILSTISLNKGHTHTDIGNAVDLAKAQVDKLDASDKPKVILVVTDGIQEAPPDSKYFSPDGTFSHALLEKATTIAKEGWKIQVIDLGGTQATKEFTEKIGGQYTETSKQPTEQELGEAVTELTGIISIVAQPERLTVPENKQDSLALTLKSQGFSKTATVAVKEIRLRTPATVERDILTEPLSFDVPADGEQVVSAKLFFPTDLEPGDYQADVQFVFYEGVTFTPSIISLTVHVNSFFENYPLLLVAVIAGGVLILALLVFLIVKLISSRGVRFRLKVDERPLKKGKDTFKVGYGKWLYLNESYGRLAILPKRTLRSIGRVYGSKKGLEFEPLREEQFVGLKKTRQNMLGQKITVKTQDNEELHAEFQKL